MIMKAGTAINAVTDENRIEEIIKQIALGSREALAELYAETKTSVYSFALSMLKNAEDAEDILQNSFIRYFRSASSYRPNGKPMAWIITITRNLCLDRIRERKRTGELKEEDWDRFLKTKHEASPEDRLILEECMKKLSDEERQIVVLHCVAGIKHREIAEIAGRPVSTVLSKYNRALKKLSSMITEEGKIL